EQTGREARHGQLRERPSQLLLGRLEHVLVDLGRRVSRALLRSVTPRLILPRLRGHRRSTCVTPPEMMNAMTSAASASIRSMRFAGRTRMWPARPYDWGMYTVT